ncbi:tetratricopeptide repeat protein [Haliangium ochraceum]|uniref:Tetratricopeptide repeat protein n=1 Tax=Haliangium ochraceum (strain DSM 14365 / JCM 11303 / SMP-2) TaxID=502025 RepID=D0LTX1_HALO1|nr:tetratricopeptide repeat protein [Haliangium ochraceum]ACY15815.1 conserved hypothetical protein [Haliangium ochraceum DSM 14365]
MNPERDAATERWSLDAHAGPARRLPAAQSQAMIDSALDAVFGPQPAAAPAPQPTPARRPGRRVLWLLAAALVIGGSAASAGVYALLAGRAPAADEPAHAERAPAPGPAQLALSAVSDPSSEIADERGSQAPAPDEPEPAEEIASAADEPSADEPSSGDRPSTRNSRRLTRRRAAQPAIATPQPAPEPPAEPVAPAPRTPEDLLKQANQQRQQRAWQRAESLYLQVVAEHPGSSAAYVAALAAAAIRLDHLGNPAGALRLYRDALRSERNRALAEEARYGVAEAYRALGQRASEQRALEEFLAHHPDSPLAAASRRRLNALGAERP